MNSIEDLHYISCLCEGMTQLKKYVYGNVESKRTCLSMQGLGSIVVFRN